MRFVLEERSARDLRAGDRVLRDGPGLRTVVGVEEMTGWPVGEERLDVRFETHRLWDGLILKPADVVIVAVPVEEAS